MPIWKQLRVGALAVALAGAAAWNAHAAPMIFFGEDLGLGEGIRLPSTPNSNSARNNFFGNLTGVGTETFESFAAGTSSPIAVSFPGAGSATIGAGGTIQSQPTGTNGVGRYPISGSKFLETGSGSLTITFSQAVAAFGFYGVDIGDFSGQVTLTLAGGAAQVINVGNTVNGPGGSALYFGIIDTATFTSVTFGNTSAGSDIFGFDDFSIGSLEQVQPPTVVPEPMSLALFGTALCGLGLVRRRRKA